MCEHSEDWKRKTVDPVTQKSTDTEFCLGCELEVDESVTFSEYMKHKFGSE